MSSRGNLVARRKVSETKFIIYARRDTLSTGERMPSVNCRNQRFERSLRLFRKKCDDAGIVREVREREYYEKPTTKRKRKKAAAVKRQRKVLMQETAHLRKRPSRR